MTKEEAKRQVYPIWQVWSERSRESNMLGLLFYAHLKKNHSQLLSFQCVGDHYQVVSSWVAEWRRADAAEKPY